MSRVTYGTISLILLGSLVAAFVQAQDNSWSSRGSTATIRNSDGTKSAAGNQMLLQRFRAASRTAASDYLSESPSSSPSAPRLLAPPQATTALRVTPTSGAPTTLVSHESSDGGPLRSVLRRSPSEATQVVPPAAQETSPRVAQIRAPSRQPLTSNPDTMRDPAPLSTHRASGGESDAPSGVSSRRPKRGQVHVSDPSRVATRRVSPSTRRA